MEIDFSKGKKPSGVILFVDDNKDEHSLFAHTMKEAGIQNEIRTFTNGEDALDFIVSTKKEIFFIISDINMPKMDGLELKRRIEGIPETKSKAIPFLFHSGQVSPAEVRTAFSLNIQGFVKKGDYEETNKLFKTIFFFWANCIHPKDFASD